MDGFVPEKQIEGENEAAENAEKEKGSPLPKCFPSKNQNDEQHDAAEEGSVETGHSGADVGQLDEHGRKTDEHSTCRHHQRTGFFGSFQN